jgi:hypothetical protein
MNVPTVIALIAKLSRLATQNTGLLKSRGGSSASGALISRQMKAAMKSSAISASPSSSSES